MASPSVRPRAVGSLTARLALAFVAVALTAIGLLAALTLWSARSSVEDLVQTQRAQAADEITAALGEAHQRAGGWTGADLRPAAALAAAAGARIQVRDAAGDLVDDPVLAMQQRMGQMHGMGDVHGTGGPGPVVTAPVLVAGQPVGTVELRFPAQAPPAALGVRDALFRTVAVGAVLGVGVALGVAIPIARRITRPVEGLTIAARRLGRGDRDARVGSAGGFAELGELGATFDRMAAALQREDELRRALVSDVAHELRTPVTILQASCEELADGLAEPTPERLASLHQEVLRLGRVVEDLEVLAAAEAAGAPARSSTGRPRRRRRRGARAPAAARRAGPGHAARRAARGHGVRGPAPAAPGRRQPGRERGEIHPTRRHGHGDRRITPAGRCGSSSPTPGPESSPTSCRTCSTGSGAAGPPPARPAAASA